MGVYVLIREANFNGVILPRGAKTPEISERRAEWLHDQGAIALPGRKPVAVPIATAPRNFAASSPAPRRFGCCGR